MVKDKLFLLSEGEVEKYLPNKESRLCMATGYNDYSLHWWLRSPGDFTSHAIFVHYKGFLYREGRIVNNDRHAIRPALHVNPAYLCSLHRTKNGIVKFAGKKWMILDKDKGLLLSKEAACRYRFAMESNEYEKSDIRSYMNNILLYEMFTDEERKMIMDTIIDGEESHPEVA